MRQPNRIVTLEEGTPLRTILQSLGILCICAAAVAQGPNGNLRGKVTDQTGAVIPQATVTAIAADGKRTNATTDGAGVFQIGPLAPGSYAVFVVAKGFAPYRQDSVAVTAVQSQLLNLSLEIQTKEEKIEVQDEGMQLDVGPSSTAGSLIIEGKDLEALSADPDELQSELQALAGPSAGPSGGQIYIDGFTGGQLPPKSAIREIRVNQNPFSAQYERMGFGRIEIFTKPGTDRLHGPFFNVRKSSGVYLTDPDQSPPRRHPTARLRFPAVQCQCWRAPRQQKGVIL